MTTQPIKVPDIGENVESGKVVAVQIKEGDRIDVDDTVIELETDKAVVEIPSPVKGKIKKVLVSQGDELKVGDTIAEVETEPEEDREPEKPPEKEEEREPPEPEETEIQPEKEEPEPVAEREKTRAKEPRALEKEKAVPVKEQAGEEPGEPEPGTKKPAPAAPSIRRLARELGVDIHAVRGSGPGGRITEGDIKDYVKQARVQRPAEKTPALPDFGKWGEIAVQQLDTVRRLTAESTTVSWRVIPHVTQFDEADITELQRFIKKHADRVAERGAKLTLTAVLAKVCASALVKFPRFNASIDMSKRTLIFKKYVHIGIAVDTPRGLLLPVIRDAQSKSISRLAVEIVDLAGRARNKKIKPDELEGGTFSISNQGGIGGVNFTPIIFWPQAAILGISRSAVQPRYIDGQFQPRTILPLSLSYDHRIIDGADAARFLGWICAGLEQPMTLVL